MFCPYAPIAPGMPAAPGRHSGAGRLSSTVPGDPSARLAPSASEHVKSNCHQTQGSGTTPRNYAQPSQRSQHVAGRLACDELVHRAHSFGGATAGTPRESCPAARQSSRPSRSGTAAGRRTGQRAAMITTEARNRVHASGTTRLHDAGSSVTRRVWGHALRAWTDGHAGAPEADRWGGQRRVPGRLARPDCRRLRPAGRRVTGAADDGSKGSARRGCVLGNRPAG
jgi:hypothetical protein